MLQLNINLLVTKFLNILKIELENVANNWEQDVEKYMDNPYFKKFAKFKKTFANEWSDGKSKAINELILILKASPAVIADSYGTGSLMLDNIPGFEEYKNSDRYNKGRKGKAIEGRKAGSYTDVISGHPRTTTGVFHGKNIEGMRVNNNDGRGYYILPSHPSYALQLAKEYLEKQWLPIAYRNTVNKINFADFLIER